MSLKSSCIEELLTIDIQVKKNIIQPLQCLVCKGYTFKEMFILVATRICCADCTYIYENTFYKDNDWWIIPYSTNRYYDQPVPQSSYKLRIIKHKQLII